MSSDVIGDSGNATTSSLVGLEAVNVGDARTITEGPVFETVRSETARIYLWPFILTIVYMCIGIVGNSVVIYIFTCKWKQTKTTLFILTLAVVDLCSCVFNMPVEAAMLWNPMTFDYEALCKISRFTTFIVSASSSFVLVAIAIDRYIMVCRPFQSRTMGIPYAKRTCVVAVLLGVMATWPSLIFYGTYTFNISKPEFGNNTLVQGKTCLVKNYYVTNNSLPTGFYIFLFSGHIVIFAVLTTLYLLIGRSLFMSTEIDIPDKRRNSFKLFGISIVSAFTGKLPSESRHDLASYRSSAISSENINIRIDHSPTTPRLNGFRTEDRRVADKNENVEDEIDLKQYHQCKPDTGSRSENIDCAFTKTNEPVKKADAHCEEEKPGHLNLALKTDDEDNREKFPTDKQRTSSASVGSNQCLTPETPQFSRPAMYRSYSSVESRSRISRIISEELRNSGVKEFSLKRNTLIMRMVTITFIVSFLPYLILVTVRFTDDGVPEKYSDTAQIVYHVFLRFYFINSMINPFIYGFMNEEFRGKVKTLFCKC